MIHLSLNILGVLYQYNDNNLSGVYYMKILSFLSFIASLVLS